MRINPYKSEEKYKEWKENAFDTLSSGYGNDNARILLKYLNDMEQGTNIGINSKKGARSYIRLNSIKYKLIFVIKKCLELYDLNDITKINENQIHELFTKMRNREILKRNGDEYLSTGDYVKVFKAFWHWWMKTNRKEGIAIYDITIDLDTHIKKPKWSYLTEEEVSKLADYVKPKYRALIYFLIDSGIRSPTELINVKVSDFDDVSGKLNIRDETSKTFGRKIQLLISTEMLKKYIKDEKLKQDDYLFNICPTVANRYIKRNCKKLFGDNTTPGGKKYSETTLYDFRHIACCYWLNRYKNEHGLKYRFGWKKSDKIYYYSEFIGKEDTITKEDLLTNTTKTEIEQRLDKTETEKKILQDKLERLEQQMIKILEITNKLHAKI